MKATIFFSFILSAHFLNAQDLSGTWEGGGMGAGYVKMVILKTGKYYSGYTYDESLGYCKANFLGIFDSSSKKLKGKGMGFIEKSFGHSQGVFNLKYSSDNNVHFLRGAVWPKSVATKILSLGIPMVINLTRTSTSVDTTEFTRKYLITDRPLTEEEKNDTDIAVLNEYDKLENEILESKQERLSDTLTTITTSKKKIKIRLFDTGVVDGDTVSIVYNQKLVAGRVNVTAKPLEYEIDLESDLSYHTITLVAHNLGTIPPNTASVLIIIGDKEYRLTASSDFKKNAVIVIKTVE